MGDSQSVWRRQVSDLIALVHNSDLSEIEIEQGAFALRLERGDLVATAAPVAASVGVSVDESVEVIASTMLHSPQVGTFYLSAEPHGEPFIHEGSAVEPGQVIGLIEAMKLINEVEAEAGGIVRRVLVEDGQPVEYGQPLFELE